MQSLSTDFPAYMAKWEESVEARGAALNVPTKQVVLSGVAEEGLLISCRSMHAIVAGTLAAWAEYVGQGQVS